MGKAISETIVDQSTGGTHLDHRASISKWAYPRCCQRRGPRKSVRDGDRGGRSVMNFGSRYCTMERMSHPEGWIRLSGSDVDRGSRIADVDRGGRR